MGITHSTARYLAPASFLFDFAAQQYGIFSKPNMQDIHYQNLAAFSPQPLAIGMTDSFFLPWIVLQSLVNLVFVGGGIWAFGDSGLGVVRCDCFWCY